jgi:hypothetical protein
MTYFTSSKVFDPASSPSSAALGDMRTVPTSLRRTRGRKESVYRRRNARRVFGRETCGNAEEINFPKSDNVSSFLHH